MFAFITGLVAVILMVIGVPYVLVARYQKPCYNIQSKRDYVIANLEKFKVNNEGSSLDEKEIYLVSHDRLGL